MKTIKLLFIALLFAGCSASDDSRVTGTECDCVEEFYLRRPYVGGGGFTYEFIFSNPIEFDCINNAWGEYYQVSNINYNYAKVNCE
jgi:hypothetical protein